LVIGDCLMFWMSDDISNRQSPITGHQPFTDH
jgi:hypothetical protein